MKKLVALIAFVPMVAFAGGEMKKVCHVEKVKGKDMEVCKTIKVHKCRRQNEPLFSCWRRYRGGRCGRRWLRQGDVARQDGRAGRVGRRAHQAAGGARQGRSGVDRETAGASGGR